MSPTPVVSARLTRHYRQNIVAPPARVFELLCPEREKEWLRGWDYRMIHSLSGLAEPGAVFATPGGSGPGPSDVIWVTTDHVAPARVRFVRFHPGEMVVEVDLRVAAAGDDCSTVDVSYTFTPISDAGTRRVATMEEAAWNTQMQTWENAMNDWFAARRSNP